MITVVQTVVITCFIIACVRSSTPLDSTDKHFYQFKLGAGTNPHFLPTVPRKDIHWHYHAEDGMQTTIPPCDSQVTSAGSNLLGRLTKKVKSPLIGTNCFYVFQAKKFKQFIKRKHPFKANAKYDYVVLKGGQIRLFDEDSITILKLPNHDEFEMGPGHSSMLNKKEWEICTNEAKPCPVVYGGVIKSNAEGKVEYLSNESGHFKPDKKYGPAVTKALGLKHALYPKGQWKIYKAKQDIVNEMEAPSAAHQLEQLENDLLQTLDEKIKLEQEEIDRIKTGAF